MFTVRFACVCVHLCRVNVNNASTHVWVVRPPQPSHGTAWKLLSNQCHQVPGAPLSWPSMPLWSALFATVDCLGNYIDESCMVNILYIPDLCPHAFAVTTRLFNPHCAPHIPLPRMLNVSIALSITICARSANLFLHLCTITLDGATVAWQGWGAP